MGPDFLAVTRAATCVTVFALTAACSDSTTPPGPLATLVASDTIPIVGLYQTDTITITGYDTAGHMRATRSVTWTSSAPNIASVSNGIITAHHLGTTIVTITAGTVSKTIPVTVVMAWQEVALAPGYSNTSCAIGVDTLTYCWGDVSLVSEGTTAQTHPAPINSSVRFAHIVLADASACGLTRDGVAYCWGTNHFGQLGDGTTADHLPPIAVATTQHFTQLAAGIAHVCGLTGAGTVYCWGSNGVDQLGTAAPDNYDQRPIPLLVVGAPTFTAITAGGAHTCGVTAVGAAYCWGWGAYGQLGIGTAPFSTPTPTAVAGGLAFVSLAGGYTHTCGITAIRTIDCWGSYQTDQNAVMYGLSPAPVGTAPPDLSSVLSGRAATCVLTTAGGVTCWNIAPPGAAIRTDLPLETPVTRVAVGSTHACVITDDKKLYCWGKNDSGQLGIGSQTDTYTPTRVLFP